jgi:hypothetical protein
VGGKREQAQRARRLTSKLVAQAREVISSMDSRGAWVDNGKLRHHNVEPEGGIIDSRTFVRNVKVLCEVLNANHPQ